MKPVLTGATVAPYSQALYDKYNRVDAYGESYNLTRRYGDSLLVPRALSVPGDNLPIGDPIALNCKFVPRDDDQAYFVSECSRLLGEGNSFIARAPTGKGKTAMSMPIIASVGRKTLVVVTKGDLRDQWAAEACTMFGLSIDQIGIIQAGEVRTEGCPIVIAMINTIADLDKYYGADFMNQFGLVIFDEVHRVGADYFCQACFNIPAKLRLGLSATPKRSDGRFEVITSHIGPELVTITTQMLVPKVLLIKSSWKVPLRKKKTPTGWTTAKAYHTHGKTGSIEKTMITCASRNIQLAKALLICIQRGRNPILFSTTKGHLRMIFDLYVSLGGDPDRIGFYHGYSGKSAKNKLEQAKQCQGLLATYAFTSEGTNIPRLDTVIFGIPRAEIEQIVGRVRREHPGKAEPRVFDFDDSDSNVFKDYLNKRMRWYDSINSEVKRVTL